MAAQSERTPGPGGTAARIAFGQRGQCAPAAFSGLPRDRLSFATPLGHRAELESISRARDPGIGPAHGRAVAAETADERVDGWSARVFGARQSPGRAEFS